MVLLTATKSLLTSLTPDVKKNFLKETKKVLVQLVLKLRERSPWKSLIVGCSAALSPHIMVSSKEESVCKFDKLYKHKRLSSVEADGANTQYDDFLRSICVLNYLFLGVFMNKKI